jgi:hypothetical protein
VQGGRLVSELALPTKLAPNGHLSPFHLTSYQLAAPLPSPLVSNLNFGEEPFWELCWRVQAIAARVGTLALPFSVPPPRAEGPLFVLPPVVAALWRPVLRPSPSHGPPATSSLLPILAASYAVTQPCHFGFSLCPWLLEFFSPVAATLCQGRHQMSTLWTW